MHWAERAIFLFYKEELRGVGQLGMFDVLLLELFLNYFVYYILFLESEGVGFAIEGLWSVSSEGNDMVPFSVGGSCSASFLPKTFSCCWYGRGTKSVQSFFSLPSASLAARSVAMVVLLIASGRIFITKICSLFL